MRKLGTMLIGALLFVGCSRSVDPAMKASVDQQLQQARQSSARTVEPPSAADPMPLAVGQWSRYEVVDDKGEPSVMTYKVVGEESGAFWLESVSETYYGRNVLLMLADFGDRRSPESVEVKAIKQKVGDGSVSEIPPSVVSMMSGIWKPILQNVVVRWEGAAQEDRAAPAGRFEACYRAKVSVDFMGKSHVSDAWFHPAVPLSGMVSSKAEGSSQTAELLDYATSGAESEIGI